MNDKIFLAANDNGVSRASQDANGDWHVAHSAAGHHVTSLSADPANPQVIWAGTRNGVLRSGDAGQTWQHCGMNGLVVKSIAVSPHDPDVVYVGTKPAYMYATRDGGKTWSELEGFRRIPNRWWWFSPAEPPGWTPYVFAITPSPTDPDVVLAGVELGAVVRSADGGRTWSRHRRGASRDCHMLKFHPTNGNWVYEAGGTGVCFSRDGGNTFQKATRGMAKLYGTVCAGDPEKPEIWYACVAPGPGKAFGDAPQNYLYRAAGGAGWQPIGWQAHPLPAGISALVTVPGNPGHLYAGLTSGAIWHSIDYGDTWEQLPFKLNGIWFALLVL